MLRMTKIFQNKKTKKLIKLLKIENKDESKRILFLAIFLVLFVILIQNTQVVFINIFSGQSVCPK